MLAELDDDLATLSICRTSFTVSSRVSVLVLIRIVSILSLRNEAAADGGERQEKTNKTEGDIRVLGWG